MARSAGGKETGWGLGKSVFLGSEETFEFSCTRCEGKGRVAEARHYCRNCHEFYCSECVQIHSEISALRTHKVLGEDGRQAWGRPLGAGPAGPECEDHDGQNLSMYCADHDAVCCPVCVSLDHKNCDQMAYIPKIAKGILQSQDLEVLTSNLRIIQSQMKYKIQSGNELKNNLGLSRQACLKKLSWFREKMKNIFANLEEKIVKEIDTILKENQAAIDQIQNICDEVLTDIQKQEKLLADRNITEQQMFFRIRDVKKEVQAACTKVKYLPSSTEEDQFAFDVDKKLETFIEGLQSLGTLRKVRSLRRSQADLDTSCIFRCTSKEEVEIKMKTEKNDCCIESMSQLEDGSIILADSMNINIKCLNSAYRMTDHLSLPSYPYDICSTEAQEAAVALHNNSVQLVSVQKGKLKASRSVELGHQCCSIAYQHGRLFISEFLGKKIYIYCSTSCSHLQTIQTDPSGKQLFAKIKCLQSNHNDTHLFVSDLEKGVLVLDHQFKVVSTLDFRDSKTVSTMCLDPLGNLFVGSKDSGKVKQIFNRNAYTVASKHIGVDSPTSILIDNMKSKLLVFQGTCGNTMLAFQLS